MRALRVTAKDTYIVRLVRNDDVFGSLATFCQEKGIVGAVFSAIGAVKNVKLGYYDLETKQYGSKEYRADCEVASMTGNITQVDGKPFVHAHAVLSGTEAVNENECVGGHVFSATVAVTLEIYMTTFEETLTRTMDEDIGLKLLTCSIEV